MVEQHEDARARLLNVLRVCYAQGHTELVFGAWGLLEHVGLQEIARIGELFKDALAGSGDCAGAFAKVTFAVRLDDRRLQELRASLQ